MPYLFLVLAIACSYVAYSMRALHPDKGDWGGPAILAILLFAFAVFSLKTYRIEKILNSPNSVKIKAKIINREEEFLNKEKTESIVRVVLAYDGHTKKINGFDYTKNIGDEVEIIYNPEHPSYIKLIDKSK